MISDRYHDVATYLSDRQDYFQPSSRGLFWRGRFARVARAERQSARVTRSVPAAESKLAFVSAASDKPERIGSIDAVRGTAMLFVCLAHFTAAYLWKTGARELASYLGTVGMIASPTFVAVSGMMVGFFAATNQTAFRNLRIKLLDRGVFILLVGHLLLALTVTGSSGFAAAYRTSFITDTIAVSIIVTPWLITTLESKARLGFAASVFLLNWLAVVQWHPATGTFSLLKSYFVGVTHGVSAGEILVFPVIPWFAAYLAATVLGEGIGRMYGIGNRKGAHVLLARIGGTSFVLAGIVDAATDGLRRANNGVAGGDWNPAFFSAIYQKFPPGPVYLGFFGGAGLLLLAAILEIDRRGRFPRAINQLGQLGRASLVVFIAQFALYVAFLGRLHLPYTAFWPVLFVCSLIVLARVAAAWDRHDSNRFLTVGLPTLLRCHTRRVVSTAARQAEPSIFASQTRPRS